LEQHGDSKTTGKRQSCHKLVITVESGISLTGEELELVEEGKQYFLEVVGIPSTTCRGSNTVKVDVGRKSF